MKLVRKGKNVLYLRSSAPYYIGICFLITFLPLSFAIFKSASGIIIECQPTAKLSEECQISGTKSQCESKVLPVKCLLMRSTFQDISLNPFNFNIFPTTTSRYIDDIVEIGTWLNHKNQFYDIDEKSFPSMFEVFPPYISDLIGVRKFTMVAVTKKDIVPISSGYSSWHLHRFKTFKRDFMQYFTDSEEKRDEYNWSLADKHDRNQTVKLLDHAFYSSVGWTVGLLILGVVIPLKTQAYEWTLNREKQTATLKKYSIINSSTSVYTCPKSEDDETDQKNHFEVTIESRTRYKGHANAHKMFYLFLHPHVEDEERQSKDPAFAKHKIGMFKNKAKAQRIKARINSFLSRKKMKDE